MIAENYVPHHLVVPVAHWDIDMLIHVIFELLQYWLVLLRPPWKLFFHLLTHGLHIDWGNVGSNVFKLWDFVLVHSLVPAIDDIEGIFEVDLKPHNFLVSLDHPPYEILIFLIGGNFDQSILSIFNPPIIAHSFIPELFCDGEIEPQLDEE